MIVISLNYYEIAKMRVKNSVVTIVADYRKIIAEGRNQQQSIVSSHNRFRIF